MSVRDSKNDDGEADRATDDSITVTIDVTNENEAGMVELSSSTPQEKQALTAMLRDLDERLSGITWQWARAAARTGTGTPISGATSSGATTATYTPDADDVGQYLRATASYTDGHGMGKEESATTTAQVQAAPQVSLALSPPSITEQDGVSTVTATLNPAVSVLTRVTVSAAAVSPAVRGDFTLSGSTLTIPANQTSSEGTVTLTAKDNKVDAETKEVTVTGTLTHNLLVTGPDPVTLTITDDDTRGVTVTPTALSVNEGASNTYEVDLTSEPIAPVTVTMTATSDADVRVLPPSLSFGTGNWDKPQRVTVTAQDETDPTDVADESATITHTVSGGDYAGETAADVAVTVEDDEAASDEVVLTVNRATVAEEAGRTTVTVTGTLNGVPRTDETAVSVEVSPGTATQGTDFTADRTSFTLTIEANQKSGTASFALTPQNDTIDEPDKTVTVRGSTTAAGLTVTPAPVTVTIEDNDNPPTVRLEVAVVPPRIREDGGTTTLTARLLNGTSSATTEVTITATLDAFRLSPNPLTIAPGDTTSSTSTLTAVDNGVDAQDKRVTVTGRVDNAQGVGRLEATTLTITDDDPPEVSGLDAVSYTERGTQPVAPYTATNPATVQLAWGGLRAGWCPFLHRPERGTGLRSAARL